MREKPPVETAQTPFELDLMVALYERHAPKRVLEIGSWHGGTLWHWLQLPGVTVVSIDDTMFEAADWLKWASEAGTDLRLLQGFSYDQAIIDRARALGPYDFIFIDAEHTYEAVKSDWDNYSPMAAPGCLVAFHDFQKRSGPYGVDILWNELKSVTGSRTVEISQRSDPPGFQGISAIWL